MRHRLQYITMSLALCGVSPGMAQAVTCPGDSVDTSSWTLHDEGDFTLRLPPKYQRVSTSVFDSKTGGWTAPGHHVHYDYGYYSNALGPESAKSFPEMVVCSEGTSKADPRIIAFQVREGSYLSWLKEGYGLAAHWPRVRKESGLGMTVALTLVSAAPRQASADELLAIIRSVRFKR